MDFFELNFFLLLLLFLGSLGLNKSAHVKNISNQKPLFHCFCCGGGSAIDDVRNFDMSAETNVSLAPCITK
jgi:hypothetical protein